MLWEATFTQLTLIADTLLRLIKSSIFLLHYYERFSRTTKFVFLECFHKYMGFRRMEAYYNSSINLTPHYGVFRSSMVGMEAYGRVW
jgi:hypothetical protein